MPCASYICHLLMGSVFCSHVQVLGIRYFQMSSALYHCCVLVGLFFCAFIQVLGIRYFQIHAVHMVMVDHASQLSLVFCSYMKLLGIRYFQRPCASYHCGISCILVWSCLLLNHTILGITYFQWPWFIYCCCLSGIFERLVFCSQISYTYTCIQCIIYTIHY